MNYKRLIFMLPIAFLMPACFLSQEEPPQEVSTPDVEGVMVLEDIDGVAKEATFKAIFGAKKNAKKIRQRIRNFSGTSDNRAKDECRVIRKKKSGSQSASNDNGFDLISVGKMSVGGSLQSGVIDIPEDTEHLYSVALGAGMSTDIYRVQIGGTSEVKGFEIELSLPAVFDGVKANNLELASGAFVVASEPLAIEWQKPAGVPATAMDKTLIVMDLMAENSTDSYRMQCMKIEGSLPAQGNTINWGIAPTKFGDIFATRTAWIFLSRVHFSAFEAEHLLVEAEGLRTFVGPVMIGTTSTVLY